ncbi:MAG TPA: Fe(3+) ABC transporter substrate-binding protein [Alphaproteobacteria bacterium]|nr:Fe(3+) ABC transporter substrate-binding protein [Alphaproteobacteria bacterium]
MNAPTLKTLRSNRFLAAAGAVLALIVSLGSVAQAAEVNVYSHRKEALIRPQLEAFTAKTGIEVNLITGGADTLLERVRSEGRNSPADVILTSDAARLHKAKSLGLLQPLDSEAIERAVPETRRDPDGYWTGLSIRARPIFYSPDRVSPAELSTYEALTDDVWRGRILIRSSSNIYNQSLLASMIAESGQEQAEIWARGMVANFARKPQGGDTDQLRALAAGEGDVAIANTYYYGRLLASSKDADRAVAGKIAIFWPNQNGRGAHINISGGAIAAHAPNPEAARQLLEFLVSPEAQRIYAQVDHEFPIRNNVGLSPIVAGMGEFKPHELPFVRYGELNAEAVRIFDRAGWR